MTQQQHDGGGSAAKEGHSFDERTRAEGRGDDHVNEQLN